MTAKRRKSLQLLIAALLVVAYRINELEEEVRELQVQSKEQLEQEQRRSKEMIARFDREKQLEAENYAIK